MKNNEELEIKQVRIDLSDMEHLYDSILKSCDDPEMAKTLADAATQGRDEARVIYRDPYKLSEVEALAGVVRAIAFIGTFCARSAAMQAIVVLQLKGKKIDMEEAALNQLQSLGSMAAGAAHGEVEAINQVVRAMKAAGAPMHKH